MLERSGITVIFVAGREGRNGILLSLEDEMARRSPWHSVKSDVHHVCSNCNTGNNIESENRREGTGGKPLCSECRDWINKGQC